MRDINFLISKGVDINKSLELFGDINTYNTTVGAFLTGAKEKVTKLRTYLDIKDMHNYSIYAHSLKSDAKYFGFTKLSELAFEHEQKSKQGDIFFINDHISDLIEETNNAINIIRDYIAGEPTKVEVQVPQVVTPQAPNSLEFTTPTILVADDSNIIRNFVKRIFSSNYNVASATDGEEALNVLKANINNDYIQCILLDLNMPRVDGFEVLKYMEENNLLQRFPVSIITGDNAKETVDKAFQYKIVDMLNKPFNEADVKRVVEKNLYFKELNK